MASTGSSPRLSGISSWTLPSLTKRRARPPCPPGSRNIQGRCWTSKQASQRLPTPVRPPITRLRANLRASDACDKGRRIKRSGTGNRQESARLLVVASLRGKFSIESRDPLVEHDCRRHRRLLRLAAPLTVPSMATCGSILRSFRSSTKTFTSSLLSASSVEPAGKSRVKDVTTSQ